MRPPGGPLGRVQVAAAFLAGLLLVAGCSKPPLLTREQAVAIATACFPTPPPGAQITVDEHNTTLSDRSFCTKRGRPVWLVEIVLIPQPHGFPHPHAFVIDAITGKVVSNGAEGFHGWPPPPGTAVVTIQNVALVTGRALALDPDLVRVAWPEGTPNAGLIHVGLSVNSYKVRYKLEGADASRRELQVDCLELRSLDGDVPWQWAIECPGGMDITEVRVVAGKEGECYLAWTSSLAPLAFAPIRGGRDRDRAIRERVDAAWNGARDRIVVSIPFSALGSEVHREGNVMPPFTFHVKSIEKLKGGGWRVGYSGVDPQVTHVIVYDGKQWRRAAQ